MIIANHHKPGHFMARDTDYVPAQSWPEKCYVQWGHAGVVISASGNYRTAFFEAFPGDNAGSFIRGEGKTIADAELAAFSSYTREASCHHRWGRKQYTDGGAICYHCGAFKTIFKPIHVLGDWRKPITKMENQMLELDQIDPGSDPDGRWRLYRRKLELRRNVFGGLCRREKGTAP